MGLVDGRASMIVEEDRISNLPDEIIHRILSFLDMAYAVQTSALSRRWRYAWTSMPYLKFDSRLFRNKYQFFKFVMQALSHRNSHAQVSTLDLTFTGPTSQLVVQDIVNYAYLYNVRQLTMIWCTRECHDLPQYLFSSHTLKHLTLSDQTHHNRKYSRISKSAWDLPSLETLNLSNMRFTCRDDDKSLNLFSKCVNLKELTLHGFHMHELERFDVCAPQLLNLTVTDSITFPEVFNVVAPQLKNLTASVGTYPNTFNRGGPHILPLSTEGFSSLEKVNLSLSKPIHKKERQVPQLLQLFQKLGSTNFLILDVGIIESLSLCLDQLSHVPGPFNKLKCLKIKMMALKQNDCITAIPVQVTNYLLRNSRNATFILDFPQKRSREQLPNDAMANKVAKLEARRKQPETMLDEKRRLEAEIRMQDQFIAKQNASRQMQLQVAQQQTASVQMQDQIIAQQKAKLQMQDQDIAEQKAMYEALKVQHDKLMSHFVQDRVEELKVLVESKITDYEVIHSMCCDLKSVRDMIPENLRVAVKSQLSSLYEGLKSLLLTRLDASKWATIETELGFLRNSERIHAAEPSSVPRWSSVDMAMSSSIARLGSNTVTQPSTSYHE